MGLLKAIKNWKGRQEKSDLKRVHVTSSGAFYMKTEDLFDNKTESITLLKKLNQSVENHRKENRKSYSHIE